MHFKLAVCSSLFSACVRIVSDGAWSITSVLAPSGLCFQMFVNFTLKTSSKTHNHDSTKGSHRHVRKALAEKDGFPGIWV